MGNKLSFQTYEDCPGPGDQVAFFKTIQVRWLGQFCDQLLERAFPKLDIEDKSLVVKWNDYFGIFSRIVEEKKKEVKERERASWHPVTMGYEMTKVVAKDFTAKVFTADRPGDGPPHLPDGHTDYAPSELSEGDESENGDKSEADDEAGTDAEDEEKSGEDADNDSGSGSDNDVDASAVVVTAGDAEDGDADVDLDPSVPKDGVLAIADGDDDSAGGGKKKKGASGGEEEKEEKDDEPDPREQLPKDEAKYEEDMAVLDPTPRLDEGQLPDGWDSSCVSPIFFGYTFLTTASREEEERKARDAIAVREEAAVSSAQETRSSLMGDFEEAIGRRADARQNRIEDLKHDYTTNRAEKDKDYNMNKHELPELAFGTYKRQWDREYKASLEAYNAELERLEEIHDRKTTHDRVVLLSKKQDLEAFKDAEAQEIPSADRLEEISRVEMHRWIEELDGRTKELERSRLEYLDLRGEVEVNLKHEDRQKQLEAARLINGAETRVRERQAKVEQGVYMLENAEVLLERAIRIKAQQDELLPLFRLLALQEIPQFVRFDFCIAALLILINGSFDEKCSFLLQRFDLGKQEWFTSHHIAVIVNMFHEASHRLHYEQFGPNPDEVNNTVLRAFLERKLSPTGLVTAYEGKEMLTHLINMSGPLGIAFGVPRSDSYCTYQRNVMSPIALLINNVVGISTCKHRQHFDLIAYKPCLEPTHKSEIHERAMSLGDDDPTKVSETAQNRPDQKFSPSSALCTTSTSTHLLVPTLPLTLLLTHNTYTLSHMLTCSLAHTTSPPTPLHLGRLHALYQDEDLVGQQEHRRAGSRPPHEQRVAPERAGELGGGEAAGAVPFQPRPPHRGRAGEAAGLRGIQDTGPGRDACGDPARVQEA